MWALHREDLTADACARLNRNFSIEEWVAYFRKEPYRCTCAGLPVPESLPIPINKRYARLTFSPSEKDVKEGPEEARKQALTCD